MTASEYFLLWWRMGDRLERVARIARIARIARATKTASRLERVFLNLADATKKTAESMAAFTKEVA